MEKYSRFRDSGTGIQVFLNPVPPASSTPYVVAAAARVPAVLVGVVRILLLTLLAAVWALLSYTIAQALPAIQRAVNVAFGRLGMFVTGLTFTRTEVVSLKNRGRAAATSSSAKNAKAWRPSAGDLIMSNFASWIDLVIAAVNFDPVFVLPVVSAPSGGGAVAHSTASPAGKSSASTARRRNAGASVVTEVNDAAAGASAADARVVLGFQPVSFLTAVRHAGYTPLLSTDPKATSYSDLAELTAQQKKLSSRGRPILVFPELVTSNNRGMLSTTTTPGVFPSSWKDLYRVTGALRMGKGQPNMYIMSVKHDVPTGRGMLSATTSTTLSVPSSSLNPLLHLLQLCCDMTFTRGIQVRLLDPDESPTSPNYQADSAAGSTAARGSDALGEAVGSLISNMARLRRTGLGWQDKEAFLQMYSGGTATTKRS